jgi:hypothetical protein
MFILSFAFGKKIARNEPGSLKRPKLPLFIQSITAIALRGTSTRKRSAMHRRIQKRKEAKENLERKKYNSFFLIDIKRKKII